MLGRLAVNGDEQLATRLALAFKAGLAATRASEFALHPVHGGAERANSPSVGEKICPAVHRSEPQGNCH
jgi:hypothetical protein